MRGPTVGCVASWRDVLCPSGGHSPGVLGRRQKIGPLQTGNLHAQKRHSPSKVAERIPTINPLRVSSGHPNLLTQELQSRHQHRQGLPIPTPPGEEARHNCFSQNACMAVMEHRQSQLTGTCSCPCSNAHTYPLSLPHHTKSCTDLWEAP